MIALSLQRVGPCAADLGAEWTGVSVQGFGSSGTGGPERGGGRGEVEECRAVCFGGHGWIGWMYVDQTGGFRFCFIGREREGLRGT